jgi:hypothetical protein
MSEDKYWWTPYGRTRWEAYSGLMSVDQTRRLMNIFRRSFTKVGERKCFLSAADLVMLREMKISLVPTQPAKFSDFGENRNSLSERGLAREQ